MGLSAALRAFAAGAEAPIFAIAGLGARDAVQDLRLRRELRLVDSPRSASILLVAGVVPEALAEAVARAHDAMPRPRASVRWHLDEAAPGGAESLRASVSASATDDVVAVVRRTFVELINGARDSEPAILPDVDPAPWRGVGPFGQGGSGMTGGRPFGRPMAEMGDDRDGLRLDVLPLTVGPFFTRLPAGLTLELRLAGDLVDEASLFPNPFAGAAVPASRLRPALRPFIRALSEPVPIRELELARARAHLRWLADALVAQQLESLGRRTLALAAHMMPDDLARVQALGRALRRTQVYRWSLADVGRLDGSRLEHLGAGPVARAAGLTEDARTDDPAYRALGFEPVVQSAGDTAARWKQRLLETMQALDLAARAGELRTEPSGRIEGPRGLLTLDSAPSDRLAPLVPALLAGLEWSDALAALISLDLDLEESAAVQPAAERTVA
ncbi:MAG: hypothetical protein IVW36_11060 [Dehalococcoidia bacterium]|nr:hypothetical protein [Dehalococcoidia bacterium]